MRALLILVLPMAWGCYLTSGPDCGEACAKAAGCPGLTKTFRLACGALTPFCGPAEAACAECIAQKSCEELVRGDCDFESTDGGAPAPLCLVVP